MRRNYEEHYGSGSRNKEEYTRKTKEDERMNDGLTGTRKGGRTRRRKEEKQD